MTTITYGPAPTGRQAIAGSPADRFTMVSPIAEQRGTTLPSLDGTTARGWQDALWMAASIAVVFALAGLAILTRVAIFGLVHGWPAS